MLELDSQGQYLSLEGTQGQILIQSQLEKDQDTSYRVSSRIKLSLLAPCKVSLPSAMIDLVRDQWPSFRQHRNSRVREGQTIRMEDR